MIYTIWPEQPRNEAFVMGFSIDELAVLRRQIDAKDERGLLSIAAGLLKENQRLRGENKTLQDKLVIVEKAMQ
jgi:hypothetical protein